MKPERWHKIEKIYNSALDLPTGERKGFVEKACAGDDALLKEVDNLLACKGEAAAFLARPVLEMIARKYTQEESSGFVPDDLPQILLHYRITERIGAGGMGEVFLAEDLSLGRVVAIKMLPSAFSDDPERLARFDREARLLASLNHPNIAAIHGFEQAGTRRFLVLELVRGETLAQRLERGALPLEETLRICLQIAEGVEAAHEKGIVHRDLKPANVMVTPEGQVKVLDFGLVKAIVDEAQTVDLTQLPTISEAMTRPGIIPGTAAYMSPEQTKGKLTDKRSDVWAFGCILFGCLTGTRPFGGETVPDIIASILGRDPDWGLLPLKTPPAIRKLLKRCLNKNPQQRLHDIADARIEIEEELKELEHAVGHPPDLSRLQGEFVGHSQGSRLKGILALCSILAIAAAVLSGLWMYTRRGEGIPSDRTPTGPTPLVTWPSDESGSRVSPDSKWVSFISDHDGHSNIWVRNLDGAEPVQITKQADTVTSQLWSPKGDEIAYLVRQGNKTFIEAVPAFFGGPPRWSFSLQDSRARLVRWIGSHLYVESRGGLQCLSLPAMVSSPVASLDSHLQNLRDYDVSPDEKKIVFTARLSDGPEDLWVASLVGGNPEQLTNDIMLKRFPVWSGRTNKIVYQSSESGQIDLWEMSIQDKSKRQITFSGIPETPEDISSDGSTLTFRDLRENANLWLWNRATGAHHQITADALNDFWPTYSGSSGILAFQRTRPTLRVGYAYFESQILSGALKPTALEDLVTLVGDGYNPRLSPDGRFLAYQTWPPQTSFAKLWVEEVGRRRILSVSERSPVSPFSVFPLDLSSVDFGWNGAALYFIGLTQQGIAQIRKFVPESEGTEAQVVTAATAPQQEVRELRFSPDQRYLSFLLCAKDYNLHVYDLVSGKEQDLLALPVSAGGRVFSRGWLDAHTIVVLRSSRNPDDTARVEIIAVDLSGNSSVLGAFERAFPDTARLNALTRAVYLTAKDGVVQNVYEFHLGDRKSRRLTDNELPGVTFSGIEVISDNEIVFTKHIRHSDISMIRFDAK